MLEAPQVRETRYIYLVSLHSIRQCVCRPGVSGFCGVLGFSGFSSCFDSVCSLQFVGIHIIV